METNITNKDANNMATIIQKYIKKYNDNRIKSYIVGSLRRGKSIVSDIDILILCNNINDIIIPSNFGQIQIVETIASGYRKKFFVIKYKKHKYKLDIFIALNNELPYALIHHTGNKNFNIKLRVHAKGLGYKLNQYGITHIKSGRAVRGSKKIKSEEDVFKLLKLPSYQMSERDL